LWQSFVLVYAAVFADSNKKGKNYVAECRYFEIFLPPRWGQNIYGLIIILKLKVPLCSPLSLKRTKAVV
jgi:hypothetical protein